MSSYNRPGVSTSDKNKWNATTSTLNTASGSWFINNSNETISAAKIELTNSTIVSSVTATGIFMTLVVNGSALAIELNKY